MLSNEELIKRINDAANIIAKSARTGSANYIICSSWIMDKLFNVKSENRKYKINKIYKD